MWAARAIYTPGVLESCFAYMKILQTNKSIAHKAALNRWVKVTIPWVEKWQVRGSLFDDNYLARIPHFNLLGGCIL